MLQTILYFGSIGFGYMFVEMVMIQKFILFLGHPVYSLSAIIAAMLVFSGFGSYVSERFAERSPNMSRLVFVGIVLTLLLYAVFLSPVLSALLVLSFGWRLVLCVLFLAPLAFLMGFPFPLGLKGVSRQAESLIPYAWGVNGYCSVMSASMAVLLAIELGFVVLFILSILMYGLARLSSISPARGSLDSPSSAR
jgi:MFS family permease